MAGITDLPFRLICRQMGADVVYSEMISATGLFYGQNDKSLLLAQSIAKEAPLAIQLFGNNPEHFAKATQIISTLKNNPKTTSVCLAEAKRRQVGLGRNKEMHQIRNLRKPEEININFGCPAPKIYKQASGCFLMKKPLLARKIIQSVLENTDLPVSIKIRTGIKNHNALQFIEKIADLKWEKVIIHGRTYEEGFSGKIDFERIREIRNNFPNKKIVVNGGIFSPENALEIFDKTNIKELAIARGCLGNPWLFQQIKDYFQTKKYQKPSLGEIKLKVLEHANLFQKYHPSKNLVTFRKHLGWYLKNFPEAKKIRKKLFEIKNLRELEKTLKNL
jgi:tRNA-dihydrouridine synthase B